MKALLTVCGCVAVIWMVEGCAMFTAWKTIPPPGGCDQCHTAAISANWKITYQAAVISDERGRQAFQTPEYNQPVSTRKPSQLESKKVEELACFECHKTQTPAHAGTKGRFHH